jgi:micrococcal nuclease
MHDHTSQGKTPLTIFLPMFFLTFLAVNVVSCADHAPYTVTEIRDGDTIVVITDRAEALTIRLACIDAPELDQSFWGKNAKERLEQIIPVSSQVSLRIADRDRYGRTVAEIYKDNFSVNLLMVAEGQAVVYHRYLDRICNETKDKYMEAEKLAKERSLGYWNQSNPIMPWEWRRAR